MYTQAIDILLSGGIGVLPTDTLYGIVGSAHNRETVERIYALKGRDENKPLIILVSSLEEIKTFGVHIGDVEKKLLKSVWPGKISVIFPCNNEIYKYLHRGEKSLAFRIPASPTLTDVLKKTGPLVAPSANMQGKEPAHAISEARNYFGETVDFYIDGGEITSLPSTIVKIEKGHFIVLRHGAFDVSKPPTN
ncbi:MAG: L-threonylcarbamoyladenylate synthase [Patescibacteria group bacterium]